MDQEEDTVKKPLATLTNVNQEERSRDFGAHYEIADQSPSLSRSTDGNGRSNGDNMAKVIKGLNSNWDMCDDSPEATSKKENVPVASERGIKTANDGMGGRKSTARHWGIGDDSDPENEKPQKKPQRSRKQDEVNNSFWDF